MNLDPSQFHWLLASLFFIGALTGPAGRVLRPLALLLLAAYHAAAACLLS